MIEEFQNPDIPIMEQIETERLILKAMEEKDAESILKIKGDKETAWWSDDFRCYDLDDAVDFIVWGNEEIGILQYGIFLKDSDDVIGYVQVKIPKATGIRNERELGYVLSKEYRRRGYMSEAVNAICNHLFLDKTIWRITLEILPDNLPSLGVARKCGFSFVEELEEQKHRRFVDDKSLDLYVRYRTSVATAFVA